MFTGSSAREFTVWNLWLELGGKTPTNGETAVHVYMDNLIGRVIDRCRGVEIHSGWEILVLIRPPIVYIIYSLPQR